MSDMTETKETTKWVLTFQGILTHGFTLHGGEEVYMWEVSRGDRHDIVSTPEGALECATLFDEDCEEGVGERDKAHIAMVFADNRIVYTPRWVIEKALEDRE